MNSIQVAQMLNYFFLIDPNSLPIALRKEKRNAPNVSYPIEDYIFYHAYSNIFKSFLVSIDINSEPSSYAEAVTKPE